MLNADDPRVAAFGAFAPGRVLTYGIDAPAFFSAAAIEDRGALGSAFDYVSPEGRVRLELPVPGRHAIYNALAALAAASVWNIGAAEAQSVFRTLRVPAMRGELLRFSNGAALINDSYNSSPAALHAMVSVLAATPNFQRRILAAGEMRELGAASPALASRSGNFYGENRKSRLGDRSRRRRRANCRRRRFRRHTASANEILSVVGRSSKVFGGVHRAR